MTYVVAVVCNEGVVVASDGETTRITDGNATKEIAQKVFRFGKNRLWGSSGDEYGISCFMSFLSGINDKNDQFTDHHLTVCFDRFAKNMHEKVGDCEKRTCNDYLIVQHQETPTIWQITNGYMAVNYFGKEHHQMLKKDGIVAIGAGQTVPRTFFKNLEPLGRDYSLAQGCLIAYRLVREAINSTYGIGEPVDIWTIQNNKVTPKSKGEVEDLKELCERWVASELVMASVFLSPHRLVG